MIWPVFQSIGQSVTKFNILGNAGLWLPSRLVHLLRILGPQQEISLHNGARVTRELIEAIRMSKDTLQYLRIPSPDFVDDEYFISKLLNECTDLRELNMDGPMQTSWSRIQGRGMYSLMECRKLEVLSISRCQKLPIQFFKDLSEKCGSRLNTFVATASNITDDALDLILKGCKKLSTLDVSSCDMLTGSAFETNMHQMSRLRHLNIVGCRIMFNTELTSIVMAKILQRAEKLKVKIGPVSSSNAWLILANIESALVFFKNGMDWDGSMGRERYYELDSTRISEMSDVLSESTNADRMGLAPFRKLLE
jgi:hypothetical protein